MDDHDLLAQFEACTLTPEQWSHRAHLKVAYLHLLHYGPNEALPRIRAGIQRLNAAHQVPEAIDRGYHETVTRGWLQLIWVTLCEHGPGETADAFFDQQSQLCAKRALLFFYSRDRIMSPEAKLGWVEPDLAPLPRPREIGQPPAARSPRGTTEH
jgi:hypothetical protein